MHIKIKSSAFNQGVTSIVKITERYRSVKRQRIFGSGIGLTLANQIMTIHKGQLKINNKSDSEYVFTFLFKGKIL